MADPDCTEEARHTGRQRLGKSAGKGHLLAEHLHDNPYLGTAAARPAFPVSAGQLRQVRHPPRDATTTGTPTHPASTATAPMTVWNTGSAGKSGHRSDSPWSGLRHRLAVQTCREGQKYPANGRTVPVPTDMVGSMWRPPAGLGVTRVPGKLSNGSGSGSTSSDVIPKVPATSQDVI